MISGVHRGAVYTTANGQIESLEATAFWPAEAVNTSALRNAAIKALHTGSGMIRKVLVEAYHFKIPPQEVREIFHQVEASLSKEEEP